MKKKTGNFLLLILAGMISPVFILWILTFFLQHRATTRMTPQQQGEYTAWLNEKLFFNPDDLTVENYKTETINSARIFYNLFDRDLLYFNEIGHRFRDLREDVGTSDTAQWNALAAEMPRMEPLLAAFEDCVSRPDYELDIFQKDLLTTATTYLAFDFQPAVGAVKMLVLKGNLLIRGGKFEDAASIAEIIMRAARAQRYSSVISRTICENLRTRGIFLWHTVLNYCDDPEILRCILERQRRFLPSPGAVIENENLLVSDSIAVIRHANRFGISADVQGKTGCRIYAEMWRVQADYMERYTLPAITTERERKFELDAIKAYRTISAIHGGRITKFRDMMGRIISPAAIPSLYPAPPVLPEEAYTQSLLSRAYYDLLTLETEHKIRKLEVDKSGQVSVLKDVFSKEGKPYRKTNVYYSIGPDGIDRGARVPYDPTNGTNSAGDIYFH